MGVASKLVMVGGVTIEAAKIRRVNTFATFTQGFLCIPAPDSKQPLVADIDEAIAGISVTYAPHQRFHAIEVSQGTAIYVFPVNGPSHAVLIAESIAEAIQPLGFTGTITACADRLGPRARTGRYAYNAAICSVDAAIDRDGAPLAFRTMKDNQSYWAVESSAFQDMVDRLARWAADNTKGPILAGLHFTMSRCEPHQVADVITRCCEDIGWAEILFPTANGDCYVHFSTEGWILPGTEIKTGNVDAIESLSRLLKNMAPLYDYAAVARVHFGLVTPVSVISQWGIAAPGQHELSGDHAAMKRSVPGIFAVQVLGPGHADIQPAAFWNVTPLAAGRRMFTAPNPDDWRMATMSAGSLPPEGIRTLREANKELLGKWA